MAAIKLRTPRMLALATLATLGSLTLLAERAEGQSVGGRAFGSYVNAPGVTAQSPVAALPGTGGYAVGEADTFGVPSAVNALWLMAVTTGAVDNPVSSSQSTSTLEAVSVLSGLIQAANVTAVASSYVNDAGAASDAAGSGFAGLVVSGIPVTTDVAPNTRVDLPGVGYAVLNEQLVNGDGVSSSGITVNMIHVYLQSVVGGIVDPITGILLGGVLTTTGEIIVGSASSSVGL